MPMLVVGGPCFEKHYSVPSGLLFLGTGSRQSFPGFIIMYWGFQKSRYVKWTGLSFFSLKFCLSYFLMVNILSVMK